MPPIYFRVNNKIIFNQILAKYESFVSKKPIEFVCHNELYDQMNWLQEPAESIDQLMDRHAFNLRNKYEKLVLLWSGGTDSHTIYNVFKRNNIHIDEIIYFAGDFFSGGTEFDTGISNQYVEWLQKNHYDPLTKITVRNRFDLAAKQQIVNSEDWILQNITMMPQMASGIGDPVMWNYCAEQYSNTKWCLVVGVEQPRVFFQNSKYYSCFDSFYFLSFIGFQNAECFYTEPQLALKQSYIIKRMLKKRFLTNICNATIDPDGLKFKSMNNGTYVSWQRTLGRHQEVLPGLSWQHKYMIGKFDQQPINPLDIDGNLSCEFDLTLDSLLKKNDTTAKVFTQGIKNLLLEKDFCNHLLETSTKPDNNIVGK
jgi:hypothetical protein